MLLVQVVSKLLQVDAVASQEQVPCEDSWVVPFLL